MRSMSIARHMKEITDVRFLCVDSSSLAEVNKRGFDGIVLDTAEAPYSREEARAILDIMSKDLVKSHILIDSYDVTASYIDILRQNARTALMDDIPGRVLETDVLINYNVYADDKTYEELYKKAGLKIPALITGSRFIPVRGEFFDKSISYKERAERVLITVGGSDGLDLLTKIANKVLCEGPNDIELILLSGAYNKNIAGLRALEKENKLITVYENVDDMAGLITSCDMAISAGGSTTYELCATGVPFIVFSFVDNQFLLAKSMEEKHAAIYAGHMSDEISCDLVLENIAGAIKKLRDDKKEREKMGNTGKTLVSQTGAKDLANLLYKIMEGIL